MKTVFYVLAGLLAFILPTQAQTYRWIKGGGYQPPWK